MQERSKWVYRIIIFGDVVAYHAAGGFGCNLSIPLFVCLVSTQWFNWSRAFYDNLNVVIRYTDKLVTLAVCYHVISNHVWIKLFGCAISQLQQEVNDITHVDDDLVFTRS